MAIPIHPPSSAIWSNGTIKPRASSSFCWAMKSRASVDSSVERKKKWIRRLFSASSGSGVWASEAAQRETLYQYRQAIISAFREVEDALVATTKGRERQTAQGRRTLALENYQRLATAQFDAGTTGYLQVLDANRSLFSSQLDYVQTQTIAFTSLIDVYRAMGGGWVDEADRMSESAAPYEDAVVEESADIN